MSRGKKGMEMNIFHDNHMDIEPVKESETTTFTNDRLAQFEKPRKKYVTVTVDLEYQIANQLNKICKKKGRGYKKAFINSAVEEGIKILEQRYSQG